MDLLERVRATGTLAPGAPVTVLLSGGGTRSACSASPARSGCRVVRARQLRAARRRPARTRTTAGRCASASGSPLGWSTRPPDGRARQPPGVGARRPVRGRSPGGGRARRRPAAGHTATDQVETVLYRLAASPGRRALLGMPVRSGRLVRPLLGVGRDETAAWCRDRGLPWREDASNATDAFARGRVRHGLVRRAAAVDGRGGERPAHRERCCATRWMSDVVVVLEYGLWSAR